MYERVPGQYMISLNTFFSNNFLNRCKGKMLSIMPYNTFLYVVTDEKMKYRVLWSLFYLTLQSMREEGQE